MEIESDFRTQRLSAIVRRNNLNKQRSRQMEQRIAKLLRFQRVPFSGAGGVKGDNIGMTDFGLCILECKLSAGWYKPLDCESITIAFGWLKKLEDEVELMQARFGALVFHYHNVRADYVIVRQDWFHMLNPDAELSTMTIACNTKTMRLPYKTVRALIEEHSWFWIAHGDDTYAVMDMQLFAARIREVE